ncbi:MAG: MGMT family protein [Candidatus Liptonbacteria bacterium]|nr:MGMT family protein [Candidatus Liptonbacteria bacterium]
MPVDIKRQRRRSFAKLVLAVVKTIPMGRVMTYKEVAALAGNFRAARAVGAVLKTNFDPSIPCHRVICSDGRPGGYNRGIGRKIRILAGEGVKF